MKFQLLSLQQSGEVLDYTSPQNYWIAIKVDGDKNTVFYFNHSKDKKFNGFIDFQNYLMLKEFPFEKIIDQADSLYYQKENRTTIEGQFLISNNKHLLSKKILIEFYERISDLSEEKLFYLIRNNNKILSHEIVKRKSVSLSSQTPSLLIKKL